MLRSALVGLVLALGSIAGGANGQDARTPDDVRTEFQITGGGVDNDASATTISAAMRDVEQKLPKLRLSFTSRGTILLSGSQTDVDAAVQALLQFFTDEERAQAKALKELEDSTVSLEFPGGTVEDFVNAVLGKFNFVPPIYQSDELRSLRMRPIKIRLMQVTSALSLLNDTPPTDAHGVGLPLSARWIGEARSLPRDSRGMNQGRLPSSVQQSISGLKQKVCVISRANATATQESPTRRAAIALTDGPAIPEEQLDALLDAISIAVNLDGDSTTFRAKYHAPSGLLIIRGTRDELGVVAQIVKSKLPQARVQLPEMNDELPAASQDPLGGGAAGPTTSPDADPLANPSSSQRKPKR